MSRIGWAYLTLLLVMVIVMTVVTILLRSQEKKEQLQALSAENERLALWRIESQLLPLAIRENSRFYNDALFVLGPSTPAPQDIVGFFRMPSSEDLSPFLWKAVGAQDMSAARQGDDWPARVTADLQSTTARSFIATNLPKAERNAEPEPENASSLQQAAVANNALQQVARSQNEYRSRSLNNSLQSDLVNQLQSQSGLSEGADPVAPLKALWVEERLYLVRQTQQGGVEGCLINWWKLKPALLDNVRDLLPSADLVPQLFGTSSDMHSLANLPLRLIPGPPNAAQLPATSTLWPMLVVAWSCFLTSAAALGLLIIGMTRLSERRAAFVSAVTHELRTPLTTFRLYADLLARRESLSPDKHQRYIDTLRREANRLHYLIENVLDWSRLERSAKTQRLEILQWHTLIDRLHPSLLDRVNQAEMQLDIHAAPNHQPICFLGNQTAIERILFNLVDNACKYAKTSTDRRILVTIEPRDRWVVVKVQDHGAGIEPEIRPRLFRPFSKSAEDAAKSAPGIGLGLSLSRRLARDMGGDLRLASTGVNGTVFELTLRRTEHG